MPGGWRRCHGAPPVSSNHGPSRRIEARARPQNEGVSPTGTSTSPTSRRRCRDRPGAPVHAPDHALDGHRRSALDAVRRRPGVERPRHPRVGQPPTLRLTGRRKSSRPDGLSASRPSPGRRPLGHADPRTPRGRRANSLRLKGQSLLTTRSTLQPVTVSTTLNWSQRSSAGDRLRAFRR